jgi:hypothetical protein
MVNTTQADSNVRTLKLELRLKVITQKQNANQNARYSIAAITNASNASPT